MKRAWLVASVVVVCLLGFAALRTPSTAQDNTEERISALETRVANLEATINATPVSERGQLLEPVEETFTISGVFELGGTSGDEFYSNDGICFGRGGYDDIGVGTEVVVKDENDRTVGTSSLEPDPTWSSGCHFVFEVEVPRAEFYSIFVGAERRGSLTYSFDDLEDADWEVELYLG